MHCNTVVPPNPQHVAFVTHLFVRNSQPVRSGDIVMVSAPSNDIWIQSDHGYSRPGPSSSPSRNEFYATVKTLLIDLANQSKWVKVSVSSSQSVSSYQYESPVFYMVPLSYIHSVMQSRATLKRAESPRFSTVPPSSYVQKTQSIERFTPYQKPHKSIPSILMPNSGFEDNHMNQPIHSASTIPSPRPSPSPSSPSPSSISSESFLSQGDSVSSYSSLCANFISIPSSPPLSPSSASSSPLGSNIHCKRYVYTHPLRRTSQSVILPVQNHFKTQQSFSVQPLTETMEELNLPESIIPSGQTCRVTNVRTIDDREAANLLVSISRQ